MYTDNCASLVKHFESCFLTSYKDGGGLWTIGYGHRAGAVEGMTITQDQADDWLYNDLDNAERRLNGYLHTSIIQCERDSLISQAFNITSFYKLISHLNNEGREVYLQKLLLYRKDIKGNVEQGLQKRRYAESLLFKGMLWAEISQNLLTYIPPTD